MVQYVLQLVSHCWKTKSIASCRSHVTRCNLELQLVMVSKQSFQLLLKVEQNFTLCDRCKPKTLEDKLQRRHVTRCNLSHNAISTQIAKRIALCSTNCRARFYLLQRLQRFFKTVQVAKRDCNVFLETIASCSPKLQNVMLFLQLAMVFFQRCKTSCKENCIV